MMRMSFSLQMVFLPLPQQCTHLDLRRAAIKQVAREITSYPPTVSNMNEDIFFSVILHPFARLLKDHVPQDAQHPSVLPMFASSTISIKFT